MRSTFRTSAIVAGLLGVASIASAQSANITATATVYNAITVTGAAQLAFGNVFPGIAKTVATNDVGAGRFDLTGQTSGNVNLTFTLPTNLVNGGNNLPIGTWTGCRAATVAAIGSCTAFTPSASATAAAFSAAGGLVVWVGGTVTPAAAQAAGTYSGTVQLTAAYF